MADYFTTRNNESIILINKNYENNIIEMFINGKKVFNSYNYTFLFVGSYTINFLLNITNINSLNRIFSNVINMRSIKFTCQFDTKNITDMSYIFYYFQSLEYIDLSNFNTQNVESMNSMFKNCHKLKSINLSNFDTQNLRNMGHMFCNCQQLESIDLSNFNTEKVENIDYMFNECHGLTSIDLSNFNTQNVLNIDYIFSYCSSLGFINIASFSKVSLFSNRFFYKMPSSGSIIINRTLFDTINKSLNNCDIVKE